MKLLTGHVLTLVKCDTHRGEFTPTKAEERNLMERCVLCWLLTGQLATYEQMRALCNLPALVVAAKRQA